jgi:hypothetical protein
VFLNERFLEYICEVLGDSVVKDMKVSRWCFLSLLRSLSDCFCYHQLKPRAEMMRTWEEKVKFTFGNHTDTDHTYDVFVPGVPNSERARVLDNIHTMKAYVHFHKILLPAIER